MSSSLASSLSSAHLGRGRSSVKSIKFNSSSSSSASVSRSSSNILSSKGRYSSNRNNSQSRVEQAILSAADPIEINEVEKVNVNGVSGILANKAEIESWKGNLPIDQYKLNQDPNPQVIKKKPSQKLHYKQEVAVRYLKPPAPEKPGDLIIVQEPDKQLPPPPPLVVRQQPPLPRTPEPLIIREAPPRTPPTIPQQVIHIPGKVIPASERKLVVEKLPEIPSKPQPIIIERWLPYGDVKRKVIYIHQEKKDNGNKCGEQSAGTGCGEFKLEKVEVPKSDNPNTQNIVAKFEQKPTSGKGCDSACKNLVINIVLDQI